MFSRATSTAVAALSLAFAPASAQASQPATKRLPAQLVEDFHGALGEHHARAVHTKGPILQGRFEPTPEARTLAMAAVFTQPRPVIVRFSDFTGLPDIPDTSSNANANSLAALVLLAAAPAAVPAEESVMPLVTQPLPGVAGKRFTAGIVTFPPGARALPHRHGQAFLYAYVLEGTVRSQIEGQSVRTYRVGQGWTEQPGAHHLLTVNASATRPARLLVTFVSTDGEPLKTGSTSMMRLDYQQIAAGGMKALGGVYLYVAGCGLATELINLAYLRASQINGCAYCIDSHSHDLMKAGVAVSKLMLLPAWREAGAVFSDRERAVLGWTEAVTLVADSHIPDEAFAEVSASLSEKEVADLTIGIGLINAYNRIAIGFRRGPENAS